jgi:hypothetical protein
MKDSLKTFDEDLVHLYVRDVEVNDVIVHIDVDVLVRSMRYDSDVYSV